MTRWHDFFRRWRSRMLVLWSLSRPIFIEKVLLKSMSGSAVTFAAIALHCLVTILFSTNRSLSIDFGIHPLFLFIDDIWSCFMHDVIAADTAARKALNGSAVFIPTSRPPTISPSSKSARSNLQSVRVNFTKCNANQLLANYVTLRFVTFLTVFHTNCNCKGHDKWKCL